MSIAGTRKLFAIILLACVALSLHAEAQKIDTVSTFSITGYIDAYFAHYTDSTSPGSFEKFPTISPRNNSPSLNTAQVSIQYAAEKVRGAAVFHYGDIAAATWAPEPYNHIMEAHAGFKVTKKFWIDAGFFRTHFGTEYLLPSENITSAVTVTTYYEPYYESGFRLNFDPTPKLDINIYLLNGYGIYIDNNKKKSFGAAVTYIVNADICLGYTNYIGDDTPPNDPTAHMRIYQNVYINYSHNKVKIVAGGDFGLQQNSDVATGAKYANMYCGLATIRYAITDKFGIYGRGEIFSDPDGFIGARIIDHAGKATGYKLLGYTAGLEVKPTPESYVRLEGRMLQMDKDQQIFYYNNAVQSNRFEIMINAGISFDLLKRFGTRISQ